MCVLCARERGRLYRTRALRFVVWISSFKWINVRYGKLCRWWYYSKPIWKPFRIVAALSFSLSFCICCSVCRSACVCVLICIVCSSVAVRNRIKANQIVVRWNFHWNCTQWIYAHNIGYCAVAFVRFPKVCKVSISLVHHWKEIFPTNFHPIVEYIDGKLWRCRKGSLSRRHWKAFCFHPHVQSSIARMVRILNKVKPFTMAAFCIFTSHSEHRQITHGKREMRRKAYLHWWSTLYFL